MRGDDRGGASLGGGSGSGGIYGVRRRWVFGDDLERKMEELREAFRMYEMDGTGCITPKSLKRMLSRLG